jgi:hypothetical protein
MASIVKDTEVAGHGTVTIIRASNGEYYAFKPNGKIYGTNAAYNVMNSTGKSASSADDACEVIESMIA